MIMSMKELKQLLFQERMKALNDAEEQHWNRGQIVMATSSVDDLRKEVEKLNKRLDAFDELMEQKFREYQKAVNEYDQA